MYFFYAVAIKTRKDVTDLLVFYSKILKITENFTVAYSLIFLLKAIKNSIDNFVLIFFKCNIHDGLHFNFQCINMDKQC